MCRVPAFHRQAGCAPPASILVIRMTGPLADSPCWAEAPDGALIPVSSANASAAKTMLHRFMAHTSIQYAACAVTTSPSQLSPVHCS